MRALPLAAGLNEGGHYFRYIIPFLFLPPLFKTTEGVVVGFQIFAWAPKIFFKQLPFLLISKNLIIFESVVARYPKSVAC